MPAALTLNFVGDLCLQGVDPRAVTISPQVQHILQASDLNVANLESPLTSSSWKRPGQPCHLRGLAEPNQFLDLFDLYSLANNHILDSGPEGLAETRSFLTAQGKKFFGAGMTRAQAQEPLCLEVKGIPLAFIGCTRWDPVARNKPGTAGLNRRSLFCTLSRLKAEGYFPVVMPHWNYEYVSYPSPADRRLGQRLIRAGAKLVVGSHPHQIQGFESVQGRYIFHSLGNFFFNLFDLSQPCFGQSFILTVCIQPDHTSWFAVHPVYSTQQGLHTLTGAERIQFMRTLHTLSRNLESGRGHKRRFYAQTTEIMQSTLNSLDAAGGNRGVKGALIRRLHRARLQDMFIFLRFMVGRLRNRRKL